MYLLLSFFKQAESTTDNDLLRRIRKFKVNQVLKFTLDLKFKNTELRQKTIIKREQKPFPWQQ
jgi:hypothetical protein